MLLHCFYYCLLPTPTTQHFSTALFKYFRFFHLLEVRLIYHVSKCAVILYMLTFKLTLLMHVERNVD
jgi:hypothetical protein